jgi:hypothetical protein
MSVEIDGRVAGLLHYMRGHYQRRPGSIIEYARRRLLRAQAAVRANLGRAGWTRLTWFDRRRAVAARLRRERGRENCREKQRPEGVGVD